MNRVHERHGAATRHAQAGQSIVEAVFLVALVAIVAVALITGIGQNVSSRLRTAEDAMDGAGSVTTGPTQTTGSGSQ
ncbi:MAG: hypothetical protein NZ483_09730 [Verrucomicrobiae bacterium]|nr:hypothetical protein [Verrucomicrobiae bacterium]MDW8343346.1 hypothetical protein [Verrucomicrobiae bacterium]